jgi:cell division protein FtsI/penicillin-binding protein 2
MNSKRVAILLFFIFLILPVRIVMHLYKTQITEHDKWSYLAEKQQKRTVNAIADRGIITDRNGEILAYSKDEKSYYVDKRMLIRKKDKDTLLSTFSRVFGKSKSHYANLIAKGSKNVLLEEKVPKDKAILLSNFVIDPLIKKEDNTRVYPYGKLAGHILGYVDKNFNGKEGLEKQLNKILKGENGTLTIECDVFGNLVTIDEKLSQRPKNGATVSLTINAAYQKILEEEIQKGIEKFGGQAATGIIMDPNTGEILALSNYPVFDPNKYNEYSDDNRKNRALTDPYEPGSVMKPIVMSILLEENKVRPNEYVNTFNGTFSTNGVKIRDTHEYSSLTVKDIIVNSSNIGMAVLSDRLETDVFYKYLRDYGFGNQTSVELPSESSGMLKRPDKFNKLTKMFMSFGYEILVTPIQIASAYCALVNGGVLYQPRIVKQIKYSDNTIEEFKPIKLRNVISPKTSNLIKSFMYEVVENGTAKNAKLENIKVGGKTGTTQRLENNSYSKSNYYTSFVGFFPVDEPKIVCYIMVSSPEKAKYGGSVAAPIFKNVSDRIIEIDYNLRPGFTVKSASVLKEELKKEKTDFSNNVYSDASVNSKSKKLKQYKIENGMPNLVNLSMRDAVAILTELGIKYKINGKGKVISQSIESGKKINKNEVCIIDCQPVKKVIE